ncbi:transcriptional regulator with XRE-family HTH domain [Anaerosolibacter carboniphilus]|uniref:Transcriptional regulator with XRE-family HTH domain n=1 Tax=Anaerosolibacter carboniphilus TaxID=1417629 RepID=A0A841KV78_9FIRM|nr:helix-turn-helix transcriptional regulator [Anaerosolibacter carboniphilus]MBB6217566.1 transcriptional regulator with XRE-family HTH domain [Anaerosolibacter carboniphilus]
MSFAIRLKKLREENHMTQEELANYLKITRQAVGNYEQGSRFPKDEYTLNAIADLFQVSIDYLLGRNVQDVTTSLIDHVLEGKEIYDDEKYAALSQLLSSVDDLPIDILQKLNDIIIFFKKQPTKCK